MATPERPPAAGPGSSSTRRIWSLVWQYAALTALSILVLGPILLTIIQASGSPFTWATSGKPLHPVHVEWKDRTWFTGGATSVIVRTAVVLAVFGWVQKVAASLTWRRWRELLTPARLVSSVGSTAVMALLLGPTYRSLRAADGNSQWWIVATMVAVALTLLPGLRSGGRRSPWADGLAAGTLAVVVVGPAVLFVGGAVWTESWDSASLGPAMRQSLIMAVLITVAQVTTSIMSAYAFVFLDFPLKRILFALFMGTLLLPLEVTLVGNVALIRELGWINSPQALVLPFAATALGTFLVRQGFRGIPPEIRDATRLDGYGHLSFLTRFAVPLSRPVIAAFTVISALGAWNQYLWPRAVIDDDRYATLQIQLRTIVGENVANANVSIAAALVAAVPVLVVLVLFQRQIIRGLTAGAVK